MLKNGVVTSASGFTINVNGLGAKPVYSNMATGNDIAPTNPTRETTIFNINYTLLFVYSTDLVEGGAWINYRGYDANTNTIGYQLRTNSSTMPSTDKFYRYRILFTSADGEKWVPSNTSSSTNATASRAVNQRPIDPFGEIVYYGTTAAVEANANPSASSLWQQYTLTLGYAFNRTGAALVLPFPSPIYIKAAPQSDGSAIIDADNPYVFSLPSTADGKIYIYLGRTYSATAIEITMNHPVYYHDGTSIKLWAGKAIPTKTSELTNDSGFLTSYTETDPTVPAWAKASSKPSYTKSEVGLGNVDNVQQYSASNPPPYPVSSVNGQTGAVTIPTLPTVTASDNNKFLKVVNGAWAAASLPTYNGGVQ